MMSFQRAMRLIGNPRERRAIRDRLRVWQRDGLGGKIVRNLQMLERFLPPDHMKTILMELLNCPGSPRLRVRDLELNYQNECHNHVRMGGPIGGRRPVLVGRAVERDSFAQWLRRSVLFHTEAQVRDFIARLMGGGPLSKAEESLLMSPFSAWVTWIEDRSRSDPFGFKSHMTAVKIRACCGLDPQGRNFGKPLLLLVYRCDGGLQLYRPTIADADTYELFQPPVASENDHGWTQTWPRQIRIPNFKPIRRPEAVHAPAPLAYVEFTHTRQVS
jgi:hypothetical protein